MFRSFAISANGANGLSDIEGKAAREAVSECGQRASFNLGERSLEVFDDFGGDEFFHSDVTPFLFLNANKLSRFTDVSVSNFRVSLRTKC